MDCAAKSVEPNPAHAGVYDDLFGRYVELYKTLNPPDDPSSVNPPNVPHQPTGRAQAGASRLHVDVRQP